MFDCIVKWVLIVFFTVCDRGFHGFRAGDHVDRGSLEVVGVDDDNGPHEHGGRDAVGDGS